MICRNFLLIHICKHFSVLILLFITRNRYSSGHRWSFLNTFFIPFVFLSLRPLTRRDATDSFPCSLSMRRRFSLSCFILHVTRLVLASSCWATATAHSFTHSASLHSFIRLTLLCHAEIRVFCRSATRLGTSLTVLYNMISLDTYLSFLPTPIKDKKVYNFSLCVICFLILKYNIYITQSFWIIG